MKKLFAILLALTLAVGLFGCGNTPVATDPVVTDPVVTDPVATEPVDLNAKGEGAMTHAEYVAAEVQSEVTVEFFVQATQGWWFDSEAGHGKITIYGQDGDGGYFSYETQCEEEVGNAIVPGTKVRITGYRADWDGEVEIMDGTVEIIDGDTYIAEAIDVTELLGTDALIEKQNMLVGFKGMTFVSMEYKDNYQGNDIYVTVSLNDVEYSFCVESYLTNAESETYKAVETLNAGDVVDIEGFLYWWQGPNTHITSVKAAA